MKQQLGERAGEIRAANDTLKESWRELDSFKSQSHEWRWQAEELRKEKEECQTKLETLTKVDIRTKSALQ